MEPIIIDKQYIETWKTGPECTSGGEEFLNTYREIQLSRFEQEDSMPPIDIENDMETSERIYQVLLYPETTRFKVPLLGFSAEVLFYMACKKEDIKITASSLRENYTEHFDFYFDEFPIDITCSTEKKIFTEKWTHGRYPTLYIPTFLPEQEIPFGKKRNYSISLSYPYRLIKENKFEHKYFLKQALQINKRILDRLVSYYKSNGNYTSSNISGVFLHNQKLFLSHFESLVENIEDN